MKIIKRYSNRKLYDTERSCYVTLEEIAQMVRDEEELQIIDNRSGEDLTTVTLAQIVLEEEKRSRKMLPINALKMIIQSPAELVARISRPVSDLRDDAQRQLDRLRKKTDVAEELKNPLREFVENLQRTMEDAQATLDERLRTTFDTLTHVPELYLTLDRMQERLQALEQENQRLRQRVARLEASAVGQRARDELDQAPWTSPRNRPF